MNRTRRSLRTNSALALLAVLLRVLLPALHDHAHHRHAAAAGEICSCGHVHGGSRGDDGERHGEATHDSHHCLACEVEAGTPCGCPPVESMRTLATLVCPSTRTMVVAQPCTNRVVLPPTRGPPCMPAKLSFSRA